MPLKGTKGGVVLVMHCMFYWINVSLTFCFVVLYIYIYIYGEKNIVLLLVPRVDSDK